ncbi:glutamate racemase [Rarobacter faecitabidus]|uniref:Glutamate racemase n=1 Tax=Rarobacter faecitabidus TaxID=13243 RepID=A0A542ZWT6_RARFA|nr:glutamate racemase [Rarobacter faecitabidus]TQL64802.1 glutamate racemase [Rarobacter faecitabidus]
MNDAPIGIFDSGVGGLTVARAVLDLLPGESILYIGDTANSPYGPKPLATVRSLAMEVMDRLVDQGVKMLVIACNSASAAVLRDARERYTIGRGLPIVEVVLPAARRAVAATHSGRIGVIGTQATVDSRAYNDALAVVPGIEIFSQACPEFVEVVENGVTTGPKVLALAHEYLSSLREHEIDTLILGCTHYPLLAGVISYVMGDKVTLVSSADETARDVYRTLIAQNLQRDPAAGPPRHRFVSTGDNEVFQRLARRFLGPEVDQVEREVRIGLPVGDAS